MFLTYVEIFEDNAETLFLHTSGNKSLLILTVILLILLGSILSGGGHKVLDVCLVVL